MADTLETPPRIRVGPRWLQAQSDIPSQDAAASTRATAEADAEAIRAAAERDRANWYQEAHEQGFAAGYRDGQTNARTHATDALTQLQDGWAAVGQQLRRLAAWLDSVEAAQTTDRVVTLTRMLWESWLPENPEAWVAYVQHFITHIPPSEACTITISPHLHQTLREVCERWTATEHTITWEIGSSDDPWDTLLAEWDGGGLTGTVSAVLAATVEGGLPPLSSEEVDRDPS